MNSKVKDYALRTVKSLILPVMVYLFFLLTGNGRFGSGASMLVIARQSVMPILLSFALAFNMSIGMWDFSAGGVVYVACIVGGNLALITGTGLAGLIFFCVATAVIMTTITALLYNFVKVPSIVLTIGLVLVYEASTFVLFGGKGVLITGDLTILSRSPYCFIILAVMFLIFYIVFNYTSFGHNVRALGNGQVIARNAGLSPAKTKFKSFIFGGLFLGVAAVINISARGKLTAAASMISVATVFDAMMGIFIGLFLTKYCNMAIGVAIGAFTMKMLNTGLIALGLSTTVRDISSGLFLLLILIISNNQGLFSDLKARKERAEKANAKYAASQRAK
jgi:ribose/xylose/arabinose/galactoside ABC-type transport system permease subunit